MKAKVETPVAELIITADGRILAHNLTPAVAAMLAELNPTDEAMKRRVKKSGARFLLAKSDNHKQDNCSTQLQ